MVSFVDVAKLQIVRKHSNVKGPSPEKQPMSEIFHKGAELELDVEKMAFGGKGLARVEGFVVFIDGALPGSRVLVRVTKAKKRFAEAETVKVLDPGPHAVPPFCTHFGKCGGCMFQDLDYAEQLRWKTEHVADSLARLGGAEGFFVAPALASPETRHFRNKMEFAFSGGGTRLALGLYRRGSDSLVNVEHCGLQSQLCMDVVRHAREFCRRVGVPAYDPRTRKGVWRYVVVREARATGQALAQVITGPAPDGGAARSLCDDLMAAFPALTGAVHGVRSSNQAVAQAERTAYVSGTNKIEERLLGIRYRISADAFFQTNTLGAELLYQAAVDMAGLSGSETVLDLYCGVGGLGLAAASKAARVVGVESLEAAVRDAEANARLNNLTNCTFHAGDVLETLATMTEAPDVAFTDPPRSGMHEDAVRALAALAPKRIIYVSCNPATLARDSALFAEQGYALAEARPVDLFPHGPHIESVARLERLK